MLFDDGVKFDKKYKYMTRWSSGFLEKKTREHFLTRKDFIKSRSHELYEKF